MLNSNLPLPYPVLRTEPIDFNTSIFTTTISVTEAQNGYNIVADFDVKNASFLALLSEEFLSFALQIECDSTWYRKIHFSPSNHFEMFIPAAEVHNRVDMCPCIIAKKKIDKYHEKISDLAEEFEVEKEKILT